MANSTALCPCQSGKTYAQCCLPLHSGEQLPTSAEQLMRSRYSAYVQKNIDYIVATTVPNQQAALDRQALQEWAESTQWLGLEVVRHLPNITKIPHSLVEFRASFYSADLQDVGEKSIHHEQSLFVKIQERWYFVDPTVPLPTQKQTCLCGSGKKFKHCCGHWL